MQNELSLFLRQILEARQKGNPAYSQRSFARDLQLSSGRLTNFLKGRDLPGPKLLNKIASRLSLSEETVLFLRSSIENTKHLRRGDGFTKQLTESELESIADWRTWSLLSLMKARDYAGSADWLATKSGFTPSHVQDSLVRLMALGLVDFVDGRYERRYMSFTTSSDEPSMALRKLVRQFIGLAEKKIETVPVERRDMTGITQMIDPKKLPQAKELIAKFRVDLSNLLAGGEASDLYQLNIQLFPISEEAEL